ncbi:MAG: leucyl aminopeptidase family protein [Pseudomonadota bacterium]
MSIDLGQVFTDASVDVAASDAGVPLLPVMAGTDLETLSLSRAHLGWAIANGFKGATGTVLTLPGADGTIAAALVGLGSADAGDPCGPAILNLGRAPKLLPPAVYRLDTKSVSSSPHDPTLAAIAWGLGAYRFDTFKSGQGSASARRPTLQLDATMDGQRVRSTVASVWSGRNLINMPANALGPEEIAQSVVRLGRVFDAEVNVHRGEADGFAEAFPLIEAVGRASPRPPRLIDLTWGAADAPKVTLIGKGIVFDTGGLDLKPPAAMLLMKKDMGGSAAAIAAAELIMALNLPVRLRLLISTAENSVAGNAFRPGDVITSRAGISVEIGNTDAEGRLVLADAIALADAEAPEMMMTFATLTGAARVGLGADLPAMFATDDATATAIERAGLAVGDPVWRMPFWPGYEKLLKGQTADVSNVSEGAFGGAITAALFLKKFVKQAKSYTHFDLYGWRPSARSLGPKGGETHTARAVVAAIEDMMSRHAG